MKVKLFIIFVITFGFSLAGGPLVWSRENIAHSRGSFLRSFRRHTQLVSIFSGY